MTGAKFVLHLSQLGKIEGYSRYIHIGNLHFSALDKEYRGGKDNIIRDGYSNLEK